MKKRRDDLIVMGTIGLVAAAIVAVYFVRRIGRSEHEADPETEPILRLGGYVQRDEQTQGSPVVSVDLRRAAITDDDLRKLTGFHLLRELNLSHTPITDRGLSHLQDMKTLERLNLYETSVTDAGIVRLKRLANLRELNLSGVGPRVTGKGFGQLNALRHLELLDVSFTSLDVHGLQKSF